MGNNIGVRQGPVENNGFVENTVQVVGGAGPTPANPKSWKINGVGAGSYQLSVEE